MSSMGALEMLRSPVDFGQLNAQSRTRAHPTLLMRYRRNDAGLTRYGISTGKRLGPAVVRNKVRRRLRTILRRVSGQIEPGWDILLVARTAAATASQAELDAALMGLMASAGVLASNKGNN
jgi:ribonuclease P protein component